MVNNNTLYHASIVVVEEPLTNVGRKDLDFGPGFYLTNNKEQAEGWARTLAGRKKDSLAVLNTYSFDVESFEKENYNKLIFSEYNKDWLDFIAKSRKCQEPWKKYDWIEGGIANDRVISTVDAYVDGFITAEQALDRLIREDLRHQVCISLQEIIDRYLRFISSEIL